MAINVKLEGGGIVAHLVKSRQMDQEARRHFHFKSKLWRAIQDHIQSKDCVLFKRHGVVATYSAGPGIALEDAYIPIHLDKETQNMVFKIRVSYWSEPGNDNRETFEERYSIYFPASLEGSFTPRKFNLWLQEKRRERDAKQSAEDLKTLERLMLAYPSEAARVSKTLPRPKSKSSSPTKISS